MTLVSLSDIKCVSEELLIYSGVSKKDAEIISDTIVYAHKRGKDTHGIIRVPIYLNKIKNKLMSPETKNKLIKENSIISVIDATHGFGQVAAFEGMKIAIEKAKKNGIGLVGIKNSNNFGTAGYFAEMAAKENMIGLVMGNSSPAIAPWGGEKPVFGTNPLAFAAPGGKNFPNIILDMATSVAARGKIRLAKKNNEKIPLGWAIDETGNPTDDPVKALMGSMLPIGEHKGYGLSLMIDILAGLLTGSAFGGDVKPLNTKEGFSKFGHLLIVLNTEFFMSKNDYNEKIAVLIQNVKNSGDPNKVFLPGENSYKKAKENNLFVKLTENQIKEINLLAEELNIKCKLQ